LKLTIDTKQRTLIEETEGQQRVLGLYTGEAFELISEHWLKIGWNQKYPYTFTWMGRPVVQMPEDLIRVQEVIYRIRPDVIIETGIAHGGSLLFYASICRLLGKGRVIGIDIDIRPHNREAIEGHELCGLITLVEGSSVAPEVIEQVKSLVSPREVAMVILDSNHSKKHVLAELEAYHGLVSAGSYVVATDGIMKDLHDVPRGRPEWVWDNPAAAAIDFVHRHPQFVLEQPAWEFNESGLSENTTYWPGAWLRRK